jgi:hypothetical protein
MTVKVTKPALNLREKLSELDKPSGIAGQDILKADTPQEVFNYIGAGRRNLIINGAMQVAQRGTSASVSNNSNEGYSTVDRWRLNFASNMGGAADFEQVTAPSGTEFKKAVKISCTTTATPDVNHMLEFYSVYEGQDFQHLQYGTSSAKELTLSFWVYTNKTGDYGVNLRAYDGSSSDVNGQVYTVTTANTWQKVVLTFSGNTAGTIVDGNSEGFYIHFALAAGTARTALASSNTWGNENVDRLPSSIVNFLDSTSNVFYITGVQLEVGSVATPFEHRSYGEELALCQRYYQSHTYTGGRMVHLNPNQNGVGFAEYVLFPSQMRATPSGSFSASTLRIMGTGGSYQTSGLSFSGFELRSSGFAFFISGITNLTKVWSLYDATLTFKFDAEL